MSRGGKREGSGRPPGLRNKVTLQKELELDYLKQRVAAAKEKLINAQIQIATGTSFLYCVHTNKKGVKEKPRLVDSQWEIERYLNGDYEGEKDDYYYITTEKPENPALDSLLNRVLGKVRSADDAPKGNTTNKTLIIINAPHETTEANLQSILEAV